MKVDIFRISDMTIETIRQIYLDANPAGHNSSGISICWLRELK